MDLLILKALSWGPMHGYGVSYWVRQVTVDTFEIQEGVLYPPSIAWRRKGGSIRSGEYRKTIARRSTTL